MFVVFHDKDLPLVHFGFDGAYCGHPVDDLELRYEYDDCRLCPDCLALVPLGERHMYDEGSSVSSCGIQILDEHAPRYPLDPFLPELCERCYVKFGGGHRWLPGMLIALYEPRIVEREPIYVGPEF